MEAQANGYAEAVALSPDGMVSEGSGQNLFMVRLPHRCLRTAASAPLPPHRYPRMK